MYHKITNGRRAIVRFFYNFLLAFLIPFFLLTILLLYTSILCLPLSFYCSYSNHLFFASSCKSRFILTIFRQFLLFCKWTYQKTIIYFVYCEVWSTKVLFTVGPLYLWDTIPAGLLTLTIKRFNICYFL